MGLACNKIIPFHLSLHYELYPHSHRGFLKDKYKFYHENYFLKSHTCHTSRGALAGTRNSSMVSGYVNLSDESCVNSFYRNLHELQTDRLMDRRTVIQTDIHTDRHTDIQTNGQTYIQMDIQTYRPTYTQTDIQTIRQTDRQTDMFYSYLKAMRLHELLHKQLKHSALYVTPHTLSHSDPCFDQTGFKIITLPVSVILGFFRTSV